MKKAKSPKPASNAHTAKTKYGMGDFYGSGIKAKVGRSRDGSMENPVSPKKLRTPPRKLA